MNEDFETWWDQEGIDLHQEFDETLHNFVKRVSLEAWSNGVYKEKYKED